MRTSSRGALLIVAAVAVVGPAVAGALGCELLVQLDPALVDAGELDGLAVEEEVEEAASMPEGGAQEAGADATDSASETSAEAGGDTSLADSADAQDAAGETTTTESGAD